MKKDRGVVLFCLLLLALIVSQIACQVVVRPRMPAAAHTHPARRIVIQLVTPSAPDGRGGGVARASTAQETIIPTTGSEQNLTKPDPAGLSTNDGRLLILIILLVWVVLSKAMDWAGKKR